MKDYRGGRLRGEHVISPKGKVVLVVVAVTMLLGWCIQPKVTEEIDIRKVKEYEDRVCVDHNSDDVYTCYDKVSY